MICNNCEKDFSPDFFPIDNKKYNAATKSYEKKPTCKACSYEISRLKYRKKNPLKVKEAMSKYNSAYKDARPDNKRSHSRKYPMKDTAIDREIVGWNGDMEMFC